jgi:hypothetical protein
MALRPDTPIQKLNKLLDAAKQGRMYYDREAWLNVAFYLNQQYSEWNAEVGSIQTIARREGEENHPRPVINKIMHFVRQVHHDAIQDEPAPDVLPATDDYQDISDSQVARAWCELQASETVTDYLGQVSRAALWSVLCGSGFKKWAIDGDKQLTITAPSPFEIYLDPYARHFSQCRHIIHSQFMDVEQVYEAYGIEIGKDGVESADAQKTTLLRGMGAAPVLSGVTVNELWMKPCRRHPKGLFAVWAGKTMLVEPGPLPYPHLIKHKMLPFTQVGCIERPDSAYYISPVQYLRPAQMELNKAHAQGLLSRDRFSNLKWWIDADLQLEHDPDDSVSQILRGTSSQPGLKPELIIPPPMPHDGFIELLEQGMMHIVGQHEVSQGQVPGRVEAAKAIELLKESDAGAIATMHKTIRASNSQGWFHALELQRSFGKEEEMVLAYSHEGVPEVKHFRAGEMKPGYRVRTTMTTGLARSRTMRQELALRLWDSKAITDPDQLLTMMEVPTSNMLQYRMADVRKARNENGELAKGVAITPGMWEDHVIHLREHNTYRKSSEFDALSEDAKQKFGVHCDMHDKFQEQTIIKQVRLQMLAQGGKPSTPGEAAPTDMPQQVIPTQDNEG